MEDRRKKKEHLQLV